LERERERERAEQERQRAEQERQRALEAKITAFQAKWKKKHTEQAFKRLFKVCHAQKVWIQEVRWSINNIKMIAAYQKWKKHTFQRK